MEGNFQSGPIEMTYTPGADTYPVGEQFLLVMPGSFNPVAPNHLPVPLDVIPVLQGSIFATAQTRITRHSTGFGGCKSTLEVVAGTKYTGDTTTSQGPYVTVTVGLSKTGAPVSPSCSATG